MYTCLHEQIRDPHGIEEVASTLELIPVVFLQVEERHNVSMPWLKIHRNRPLPLPASLAHTKPHETSTISIRSHADFILKL